ncbi:MAG: A/G-specific adenine glycosylase [Saprospiraceae bacterium]|nr:A/G-specific adenine glycosylase [Saprospiraceae bacterium]
MNHKRFTQLLLEWHQGTDRDLPWKKTNDPYFIWLSEIILQQTRVKQALPYFHNFVSQFPTIHDLAYATEDAVMKTWEGLGYYSRARNLHATAKYIVNNFEGQFPSGYNEILSLKGVGPYTAAAIASFAFGHRYAVVDGNVIRVISRIKGIREAVDLPEVKAEIQQYVDSAICYSDPALFNQAIMDFGATHCTFSKPLCHECILKQYCKAFNEQNTDIIPVKSKKPVRKSRYFHFFHIDFNGATILFRRDENDIWKNLYTLPFTESVDICLPDNFDTNKFLEDLGLKGINVIKEMVPVFTQKQTLTHQNIFGAFYTLDIEKLCREIKTPYYLVESKKVSNFAFPKIINDYFRTHLTNEKLQLKQKRKFNQI